MKDVLEDSSDSENDNHKPQGETPVSNARKPVEDEPPVSAASASASASEITSAAPAEDNTDQAKPLQQHPSSSSGCVISILPPDLLLQCAEYLGDARSLCRVREVCLGWLLALDDREAGSRLWRPLFCRLRASGSIHKATDATGQQNRQLKVYDLGTTPPNRGSSAAAFGNGLTAGVSTPSPSQKPRLSSGGPPTLTAGKGASWSSGSGSAAAVTASSCVVCGLIQREGYSGKDCEMCASALVLVRGRESPATPRLAYTRVNLSGGGGSSSSFSSPTMMRRQQHPGCPVTGAGSSPSPDLRLKGRVGGIATPPGASADGACETERSSRSSGSGGAQGLEEEFGRGARSVDWHFLVKRLAEEKRIASGWGSLQHGWVWLQRELQVRRVGAMVGADDVILCHKGFLFSF